MFLFWPLLNYVVSLLVGVAVALAFYGSASSSSTWTWPLWSLSALVPPGAEEGWEWRSLRPLALPSFVVQSALFPLYTSLVPVQLQSVELVYGTPSLR